MLQTFSGKDMMSVVCVAQEKERRNTQQHLGLFHTEEGTKTNYSKSISLKTRQVLQSANSSQMVVNLRIVT